MLKLVSSYFERGNLGNSSKQQISKARATEVMPMSVELIKNVVRMHKKEIPNLTTLPSEHHFPSGATP